MTITSLLLFAFPPQTFNLTLMHFNEKNLIRFGLEQEKEAEKLQM